MAPFLFQNGYRFGPDHATSSSNALASFRTSERH